MTELVPRRATRSPLPLQLLFVISIVGLYLLFLGNDILRLIGILLLSSCILSITHTMILRVMYSPPRRRRGCIDEDGWSDVQIETPKGTAFGHISWKGEKSDLLVIIHGWSTTSKRSMERADPFLTDYHVMALDLRGHGHSRFDPEFSAAKCAADAAAILSSMDSNRVDRIIIWGHSLGAFVAVRLMSSFKGWWSDRIEASILESPMTDYNLIFDEYVPLLLKPFKPILKGMLRRSLRRIHPDIQFTDDSHFRVPEWGMPTCRCLVVHPSVDERLGDDHLDLLRQHAPENMQFIELSDMKHSGSSSHHGRTEAIRSFL